MIINIVAGGPKENLPNFKKYEASNSIWVGVDRGVFYLIEKNIKPYIAFGDFDSVTPKEMAEIEKQVENLRKFKPEKDETDLELAMNWAIEQSPTEIRIFGATGGRLDHLFGNIQLLIKPVLSNVLFNISLIDNKNIVFVKSPGCHAISKNREFKYISFVAVTSMVKHLTLKNFKYPLDNCHISIGSTLCISNELIDDHGTFSFSEGILLVVRSHD